MAALTTPRDTKSVGSLPIPQWQEVGIKAGAKVIQGGMVGVLPIAAGGTGYAEPMPALPNYICLGISTPRLVGGQTATAGVTPTAGIDDNTSGTAGQLTTMVTPGTWKLKNGSSTDAVLVTDIGGDCFALDDNSVARTDKGGTLSRVGKIIGIDTDGQVMVNIGIAQASSASGTTLNNVGYHAPVRAIYGSNFVGTEVSGVLTATSNGAQAAIDGVTLAVGDRVLLAAQTTAAANGIYVVTSLGSAGTKAVFTRAADAPFGALIVAGERVSVSEGTQYSGSEWTARVTGNTNVFGTNDAKFYPAIFKKTVTLVAGAYTFGSADLFFLFATGANGSIVSITRNTANTSTATTGGYAAITKTAGVSGTGALVINAQVAAGTINNADISTVDVIVVN